MNTRKEYGTAGPGNSSYDARRLKGIPVRTLFRDKADSWYKMYVDQKMSVREISRQEGVAYSTVHNQLKALLVPFRPRGQSPRKAMVQGITKKLEENKSTATRLVDIETRLDAVEHRADWASSGMTTDQLYDNSLMLSTEINTLKKHFKWSMWAGLAMTVLGIAFEIVRLLGWF